jgi:hypothetical protein
LDHPAREVDAQISEITLASGRHILTQNFLDEAGFEGVIPEREYELSPFGAWNVQAQSENPYIFVKPVVKGGKVELWLNGERLNHENYIWIRERCGQQNDDWILTPVDVYQAPQAPYNLHDRTWRCLFINP